MRELIKGFLSVFIHFAVGFLCCLLYVLFFTKTGVLPRFSLQWKLAETGLLFIRIMPAMLVSSILIGYAVIFGTCGQNTVERYSLILVRYLKEAFIILFACISLYLILIEIAVPMLDNYRRYTEFKTRDYYDFISKADISLQNHQAEEAYANVQAALAVWKDNPEALALLDSIKVSRSKQHSERKDTAESKSAYYHAEAENLTVEGAFFIAKRYMENQDFYSAHFYASKAYQLSIETDPYREDSLRMMALAWNQIEKGSAELKADFDIRLYRAKQFAYELMQQKNYIKAYYQFLAAQRMVTEHDSLKHDPDIDRFVEITRKKLLEEAFFIDETKSLLSFESARNVSFILPPSNSSGAVKINIEGLSSVFEKGIQEMYGRNCEIAEYSLNNQLQSRYRIPYIKIIPIIDRHNQPRLRVLFQAVDEKHDRIISQPILLSGVLPLERNTVRLLPFSYAEFELIIAANAGERTMSIPQLYRFRSIGPQYGFAAQIYHREILARLSDLFVIIILSIFMLVLAWSFRIPPHQPFRSGWALSFPVFFVMATGLIETVRYGTRLVITLFTDHIYVISPAVFFFIYVLLLIGVSFLFCAQRSETY